MTDEEIKQKNQELADFLKQEREKNMAFLSKKYKKYKLSDKEINDIFNNSCLELFKNIQDGKLVPLKTTLSAYLTKICKVQGLKTIRETRLTEELLSKYDEILHDIKHKGNFFKNEKDYNIMILRKKFKFSETNAEDIYQEACIAMYKNVLEGKLEIVISDPATYLKQTCQFQALKKIRDTKDFVEYNSNKVHDLIEEDSGYTLEQRQLMKDMVKHLPKPCDTILRLYYEGKSMEETLLEIDKITTLASLKVRRSQCISKLKATFENKKRNLKILSI